MPSKTTLSPIKHTCFLFDQFAIANPQLRLFALHACQVVANRIQAFIGPDSPYTPMNWKRTPILYLVDDEAFLDGVTALYREYKERDRETVVHNDLFELLLLAVEQDWDKNEYIPMREWFASVSHWTDAERLRFFQELFPGQFV